MKPLNLFDNSIIIIIGPRSGSKSIIDKNVRLLNGKSFIYCSVTRVLNTAKLNV
jgi:CMP-N-acetylneuraminic acid synthetase